MALPYCRRLTPLLLLVLIGTAVAIPAWRPAAGADPQGSEALRVCADPNNLPFSNDRGAGFENKLAELFAKELGQSVLYTWWAQRRGNIRNTLKAGKCDVLMGVPIGLAMVETTRPYYRSSYVFVTRSDRHLDITSMTDPRLKQVRIGVELIGDDGFNTPPAHVLAEQGIIENVVGYTVYGDYRSADPPARIVDAVARGDIDIAAVWGPMAGYFARLSPAELNIVPIVDTERFLPLRFQFEIAVGVRKGDDQRRVVFDQLIARNAAQITQMLDDYGVPVLAAAAGRGPADRTEPVR
jgi:quinoprotein dehydrogenase-associated probable ABC transporter substrate-binding protein